MTTVDNGSINMTLIHELLITVPVRHWSLLSTCGLRLLLTEDNEQHDREGLGRAGAKGNAWGRSGQCSPSPQPRIGVTKSICGIVQESSRQEVWSVLTPWVGEGVLYLVQSR